MPDNEFGKTPGAETYIGDGIYASFDGYYLWLRAPRERGDHMIAIEPRVLTSINELAQKVWPSPPPA